MSTEWVSDRPEINERPEITLIREYDRLVDHLLLMHRRENRVMVGGEEKRKDLKERFLQLLVAGPPAEEEA